MKKIKKIKTAKSNNQIQNPKTSCTVVVDVI